MTYYENEVIINGKNGLNITDGSFIIKAMKITRGEDPDGNNKIGNSYHMLNGKLSFIVGRNLSGEVAKWFNRRFSVYNDFVINGDRTTFDHKAGGLNFAFVGDLSITVSGGNLPGATKISFCDVGFAQGKTGLSNNWWFAQMTGQRTKAGGNTLLTIGSDADGHTVYASFWRGGNKVNEVSLLGIQILSDSPKERNVKTWNIPYVLTGFKDNGTELNLPKMPLMQKGNIQGITVIPDENFVVCSHSVARGSYGRIIAGKMFGDKCLFKSYRKGWKHPGGINAIGDYVLVPSEKDEQAVIAMYDTRSLHIDELRRVETFQLDVLHKAASLGITDYTADNGQTYYILIICYAEDNEFVYAVYRADASDGIERAVFTNVAEFNLNVGFEGFGLLTGTNNKVYLLGLNSIATASYKDEMYLYEINTNSWLPTQIGEAKHVTSRGGGVNGVHFRWGAGVFINSSEEITALATECFTLDGTLKTDKWVNV